MNACPTYANGTVAAVVEVDVETGGVRVLDYMVAHDCGTVINPVIVEGQIIGGVAQGLGGSLLEDLAYSPEGQPLATTFMDYVLPSATEVPTVWISHHESPSPNTAFGAKGMGEAGVIGCYTVVAQAIEDALRDFGVEHVDRVPISPQSVRRLISGGGRTG